MKMLAMITTAFPRIFVRCFKNDHNISAFSSIEYLNCLTSKIIEFSSTEFKIPGRKNTYNSRFPHFFSNSLSMIDIIGNENVIKNGAWFNLPQIESDGTNFFFVVQFGIWLVLRVIYFRVNPCSFVIGIIYLFGFPFALERITHLNQNLERL